MMIPAWLTLHSAGIQRQRVEQGGWAARFRARQLLCTWHGYTSAKSLGAGAEVTS